MKQSYTVVLDRMLDFEKKYESEPYEAGWADEVVSFIRIHQIGVGDMVKAKLEISPDGIEWVAEGAEGMMDHSGVFFLRTTNFGGWLRLVLECGSCVKVTTYLALKG